MSESSLKLTIAPLHSTTAPGRFPPFKCSIGIGIGIDMATIWVIKSKQQTVHESSEHLIIWTAICNRTRSTFQSILADETHKKEADCAAQNLILVQFQ